MATKKSKSREAQPEPHGEIRRNSPNDVQRYGDVEEMGVVALRFRIVLISVLVLTVLFLLIDMTLVLVLRNPSTQAQNLMDLCSRLATIGFGAIIGLLGGKAA